MPRNTITLITLAFLSLSIPQSFAQQPDLPSAPGVTYTRAVLPYPGTIAPVIDPSFTINGTPLGNIAASTVAGAGAALAVETARAKAAEAVDAAAAAAAQTTANAAATTASAAATASALATEVARAEAAEAAASLAASSAASAAAAAQTTANAAAQSASLAPVATGGNLAASKITGLAPVATGGSLAASNVTGLAASATTDTTNAGNITAGTLNAARLPTITSLGTVLSGTWQGNPLGLAFLSQGGASLNQTLLWTGTTWTPTTVPISVAGRTGAVTLSSGDISNFSAAASSSAPVQSVASRTGFVTLTTADLTDWSAATAPFLTAAPVTSVAGKYGNVTLALGDISGSGNLVQTINPVNPTYGASCTGRTLTDVTTTSGSATISSASYTFQSSDVGDLITIGGGSTNATTGNTTNGSPVVASVGSQTGIKVGDYVYGAGIQAGTRVMVLAVPAAASITLTAPATATATGASLTFAHIVNTTISSVSGGNATLATTLGISVSGTALTTFGPNDYTGLAAALTAASTAPTGATVTLPRGMCVTNASLVLPTRVSLIGQGAGQSIIKWISSSDQATPVITNGQSYTASTCTSAAAVAGSANQRISGIEIDGAAATLNSGYQVMAKGISLLCSYNIKIDNNYVHDTPATGIATDFGFRSNVVNNLVENPGRLGVCCGGSNGIGHGLLTAGGDSYNISGNIIINPAHYGAFVEAQAATTSSAVVSITGNIVTAGPNSMTNYAGIGNSGSAGATITGNQISGYWGTSYTSAINWQGISVDAGTLADAAGTQTAISGNVIKGTYEGIQINYQAAPPSGSFTAQSSITGNTIAGVIDVGIRLVPYASGSALDTVSVTGNTVSGSGSAGVAIIGSGVASNITISGNTLANNGATIGTAYRQSGIAIGTTTLTNVNIHGNRIYDNASGTQKYGIGINSGTTVSGTIQGNDLTGNATSALLNNGTLTGWVTGNRGYNPVGAATVTPGASPWIYTAGITQEELHVNGGTVSSVVKGGITLATSSPAQVLLNPGESVTITYSSVPTAATSKE